MSELLQAGHHPDADQLNAFVEHTLPAHEQQQTLAHLSVCPACRQIVALSLPPDDESPAWRHEFIRNRWFSARHLTWTGIPALAALILLIIFMRDGGLIPRQRSAPAQMANARPPAAPPAVSTGQVAAPEPTTPPVSPKQRSSRTSAAAIAAGQQPETGRDAALLAEHPNQKRAIAAQNRPAPSGAAGAIGGILGGVPSQPPQPQAENTATGAAIASPVISQLQARSNSAGSVGGPVAKTSPIINTPSISAFAPDRRQYFLSTLSPLPSHLAFLSVASHANQRLAIDIRNNLFFSDDNGRHWKAVPSQWKGRAVRVAVTSAADNGNAAPTLRVSSLPAATTVSTLSGTITDPTGAVIPDATVAATYLSSALVSSATTDRLGQFRMENLAPGSYQIEAHATGFETQTFAVEIEPSQQAMVDVTLPVASATQSVTVQASPGPPDTQPVRATDNTNVNRVTKPPASHTLSSFELTTDAGDRWASTDGQTWNRE